MPGWFWAFIVGSILAHGHTLVTNVKGVDPTVYHRPGKYDFEWRTWTAPRWEKIIQPRFNEPVECSGVLFSVVTTTRQYRLVVDGEEQLLDTSWSKPFLVEGAGEHGFDLRLIDPVTREERTRRVLFKCTVALPDLRRMGDGSWQ